MVGWVGRGGEREGGWWGGWGLNQPVASRGLTEENLWWGPGEEGPPNPDGGTGGSGLHHPFNISSDECSGFFLSL